MSAAGPTLSLKKPSDKDGAASGRRLLSAISKPSLPQITAEAEANSGLL
jgi:hypothetical protein